MTKLELEDFEFKDEDKSIKFMFMKHYFFLVDKSELEKIGSFKVDKDFLEFDASDKTVTNKINKILKVGLNNLFSVLGKRAIYIHEDSGIPLIGTNEFGIIDRDTNIIEVKPHTLCNLDCIYCSVDAGKSSRKTFDFVVQPDYLIKEFNKVSSSKKHAVEASINPQGEPLFYSRIVDLVKGLKRCSNVKTVSINTNGTLLSEQLLKALVDAGLNRINLSLNTVNKSTADKLSGGFYDLEKVKKIINYCKNKIEILVAPLIVPGFNDSEIEDLISFCLENNIKRFGFQNFLNYQKGRNPVKAKSMKSFFDTLKIYEKKFNIKLINDAKDYNIFNDKSVIKPFRKNQVVFGRAVCAGKYPNEFIAVSDNRCITISKNLVVGSAHKLLIVRDKHNIFKANIAT